MSEGFTITARIRPSVDTVDAVVCAKLLEIWLNEVDGRRVEVTFKDDGHAEIDLIPEKRYEPHETVVHRPIDPNDISSFPW